MVHLTETDTFLDLLIGIERIPDRREAIAQYRAWIERHGTASPALYGGYFNLGVELGAAGDRAGAIAAYQQALALRPGFYPAAINLGTVLEAAGQPGAALSVWQQALQSDEARTALLTIRDRLAEACRVEDETTPLVLRFGRDQGPELFGDRHWREIRLGPDPASQPDILASITDMRGVADESADAVHASHAIEHLFPHEVSLALREVHRVLKPDGFLVIQVPDLQEVARHVAEGKLEDPLYMSPVGPIAPLDILYGHRPSLASAPAFTAPRTGFTAATLGVALVGAGFPAAVVQREPDAFRLTAIAFRREPDQERLSSTLAPMHPAPDRPAVLYRSAA
jgi:tetratricopeptide (TPR) repeat protein